MNCIREGDSVLIVWNNHDEESLTKLVEEIKYKTKNGIIILENSEVITEHSRPHSAFDVIVSNWIFPYHVKHTDSLLGLYLKLLKPTGRLILKDEFDITTSLKINGFVKVFVDLNDIIIAQKPDFEIGSKCSLQLSDRKPSTWKLDNTLEEAWSRGGDDETIDDNQLLDENDMIKPDKQSLRVCATTGKRKACADCVCGLAEELSGQTKETPKSSCGSCYLGDAFRCASCPYLGMPAFKPGDKVVLDLKSDI